MLGVFSCLGLIAYLPPTSWVRFFVWLIVGLGVYFAYGYRRSRLQQMWQRKNPVGATNS